MGGQLYAVLGHGAGRGGEGVSGVMCVVNIFDIHLKKQRCSEIGIFDRKRRVKHGLDWSHFCHWTVFNHLSLRLGHHIS